MNATPSKVETQFSTEEILRRLEMEKLDQDKRIEALKKRLDDLQKKIN